MKDEYCVLVYHKYKCGDDFVLKGRVLMSGHRSTLA